MRVALLDAVHHRSLGVLGRRVRRDRLVDLRIERVAVGLDLGDAARGQELGQLHAHHVDARDDLGALLTERGDRALQVVDDREQIADQLVGRGLRRRLAIALAAAAEIVELRLHPLQRGQVLVSLATRLGVALVGARLTDVGGAVERALERGCTAFQSFCGNPRGWTLQGSV